MHLEMVRATNPNKRFVIKVGYYSGPWPTPEPDGGGDREHCELGEEGRTTCIIMREELLIYAERQIQLKTTKTREHTHTPTQTHTDT